MKATPDLEGWDDWMVRYIAAMPPEQLLAHLKPEDLAHALSESDRVLALPDAALRGLSPDYLATLPEAAQQRIRERIGR